MTLKAWTMFPRRIKSAMFENNMEIKDLAAATGLNANAIYAYAEGKRLPRMDSLERLCRALDVSADWLMGRDEK